MWGYKIAYLENAEYGSMVHVWEKLYANPKWARNTCHIELQFIKIYILFNDAVKV